MLWDSPSHAPRISCKSCFLIARLEHLADVSLTSFTLLQKTQVVLLSKREAPYTFLLEDMVLLDDIELWKEIVSFDRSINR